MRVLVLEEINRWRLAEKDEGTEYRFLDARSQVWIGGAFGRMSRGPDAAAGPNARKPERDYIRLRSVGWLET
jgi:hypothetical protein